MAEGKEVKHVVMFPYMAQGHFIPFLTLAKILTSQGLAVTFLTTAASAPKLQLQAHGSNIHIVPLSLPSIPGLPPGCESTDVLSYTQAVSLFLSSHKLSRPFEDWLEHLIADTSNKPTCIISDVFFPWTAQSASKFGIPRVVFHTTGAMAASLLQYLFTNPVLEIISDSQIIEIRDCCVNVDLRRAELPHMLRNEYVSPELPDLLPGLQQAYASGKENSAATVVNTFDGLEAEYVKYLEESTGKPAWCIASPFLKPQRGIDNHESECIRWLDTQKENSVLYISFGSQAFLSEEQTKALAKGIAASNQAFIWTIKDPVGAQVNSWDYLPEGFIEETRNRGMVIHGWVPQLEILFHSSIACFMSHCGWNSTLESISAGVAMVAWPMAFDQFFNARLVIEKLGIGLQMCEGYDAVPSSDVVENTVKAVMTEEVGKKMRQRALQINESINEESSCKLSVKAFVSYILSLGVDESKGKYFAQMQ